LTQEIFTLDEAAAQFDLDRVNKAGAKFDWDKLDWINSQYLHSMATPELTALLIPYWQEAGYELDPERDRAWLEALTEMIAPSLTRLPDAVAEVQLLMSETVTFDEKAIAQMQQAGVAALYQGVLEALEQTTEEFTAETAQGIVKAITKTLGVKKGFVMKSLRAGLTGALQGPDLIQSWVLLHQKGWDEIRLQQAVEQATG
jgi:glutamyl-tRNA synthetase